MLDSELIKRLEKFLAEHKMLGKPATGEQIAEAEQALNAKFPDDYVDFITQFGGAYAGIAIHAFENASGIGKATVVEMTRNMRQSFGEIEALAEEALQSIVFSDDGSGNPILLNQKGEVVLYEHDNGEREVLAKSLGKYIEEVFEEW